jgi:uncharacterized protein YbcV (DUF1398 family)
MNPLGIILYGSKSTVPEDKRLKLEIYYTKPNNIKLCESLDIGYRETPIVIKGLKNLNGVTTVLGDDI